MFASEELESFHRAGRIVSRLRKEVSSIVKPGRLALECCEEIERRMRDYGGRPAFPVNVGINEVAAHYTSPPGDTLRIPSGSLVKVDFGVHVNGYVTDTSVTLFFDPGFEPMARAADEALSSAIRSFKPGVRVSDIGRVIESTVTRYGFKPIRNLTGHNIERYAIHAGKSVPNVPGLNGARIVEGEIYAIEPFVTLASAKGSVRDGPFAHIHRLVKVKGPRDEEGKLMLGLIRERFLTLPFAARWLEDKFPRDRLINILHELIRAKCVSSYPVLVEETGKPVAQSEHTVLVGKDGCTILTE